MFDDAENNAKQWVGQIAQMKGDATYSWTVPITQMWDFILQYGKASLSRGNLRKDLSRLGAQWVSKETLLSSVMAKKITKWSVETRKVQYRTGQEGYQFRAFHDMGNWLYV